MEVRAGLAIKARIWIGFGAVSALLVLVAATGLYAPAETSSPRDAPDGQ